VLNSSVAELIRHPDALCDQFGVVPKPYWLIALKVIITQVVLGQVFRAKPKTEAWLEERPTRLELWYLTY
jgi:hypothetical protein